MLASSNYLVVQKRFRSSCTSLCRHRLDPVRLPGALVALSKIEGWDLPWQMAISNYDLYAHFSQASNLQHRDSLLLLELGVVHAFPFLLSLTGSKVLGINAFD